jgi:hypothetical protein
LKLATRISRDGSTVAGRIQRFVAHPHWARACSVPPKSQTSETLSHSLPFVLAAVNKSWIESAISSSFFFLCCFLFRCKCFSFFFKGKEDQKGFSTCLTMLPGNQRIST